MRIHKSLGLTFALCLLFLTPAFAESSIRLSKIGSDIKALKTSSSLGVLFGTRYVNYESDNFSIGGAAYTGQLSNPIGTFTYGGLYGGYTGRIIDKLELDLTLLAGAGGGTTGTSESSGGIVLEPGLALNFILGPAVRICTTGGYAWMPSTTTFSGVTFGLRFDFLLQAQPAGK